ncbi:MAG TPA: transposase [Candidatus Binatia bacterium]|jgi:REP element-mobilizing transposase RayT|nr:transposase [Candidatus Binatia bacterium]
MLPGTMADIGNRDQLIGDDPVNKMTQQLFLAARNGFTLYAYVLMPNHFHMLLQVAERPLSKATQSLLYRYSRYYNQRYQQLGHLFAMWAGKSGA